MMPGQRVSRSAWKCLMTNRPRVISGVLTLFVDLSQTASEQLQQVEETLSAYEGCSARGLSHAQDLGKRAA